MFAGVDGVTVIEPPVYGTSASVADGVPATKLPIEVPEPAPTVTNPAFLASTTVTFSSTAATEPKRGTGPRGSTETDVTVPPPCRVSSRRTGATGTNDP